jgi:hypothetical protein
MFAWRERSDGGTIMGFPATEEHVCAGLGRHRDLYDFYCAVAHRK